MAELVGVFAASHAPLIARDWSRLPAAVRLRLSAALEELGRRLMAERPDILIEISPDHWVNFSLTNLPSVCIGVGAEHVGPPEPFLCDFPFRQQLVGAPDFAMYLLTTALDAGFEPSLSYRLTLDHGFCIPLQWMRLASLPPIVPIIVNDLEPPMLSLSRCLQWGRLLRRAIDAYPSPARIAVLATGGLSHSIGEASMGEIDEPFDRACLEALAMTDPDVAASHIAQRLSCTGNGGHAVRNWLMAHGAAVGRRFELIDYLPCHEVYVGCAFAAWPETAP